MTRYTYRPLVACFFLSGFSALVYESVWTRYLQLFLGADAFAQAVTLVIFMGGMAAGAWAAGRMLPKSANPLLWYAMTEAVIGLMGLAFHPIFMLATGAAYDRLFPALGYSPAAVELGRWVIAALLAAPQSVLLGATFPLMAAGMIRLFPDKPGRMISVLYFANCLGGAVGALVCGFYLVEALGLPGATMAGGGMNILVAAVALVIARASGPKAPPTVAEARPRAISGALTRNLLLCAGLTGAASFLYEIGWIRMLTFVLGSTSHSFELMLSAFILGLALGGLFIRGRIEKLENHLYALAIIQVAMGALALATIHVYGGSFWFMAHLAHWLHGVAWEYFLYSVSRHAVAMAVMLPATIMAGMTLPLITSYLLTRGGGEASIGHVYAANTLGAIAGVILGSQFIMTMMGLEYVVIAGAVMDIAVGGWLFRMAAAGKEAVNRKVVAGLGAMAFIAAASAIVMDPMSATFSYARAWNYSTKAQDVAFHKDGKTATVDVFLDTEDDSYWTLNENGLPQAYLGLDAPKNDEVTNTLLGALPWDVNPSISSVAVVGLGSGLSASVALEIPSISRMDVVEIEPVMVEGSRRLGGRVAKVHNDPRVRIHIDDARAHFAASGNKYDLIVSEPSHIWVAGVAGLFTTEFYSMARRSLNDGGMLAQWLHLHDQAPELVASVMAAISANFEDYQVYLTWDGNILVLARKSARVGRPTGEVFKIPQIRERLRWVGIESANDFYIRWLGGKKSLDPFFRSFGAPMNSDYHPYLSFGAIRAKYYQMDAFALGALRSSPAAIIEGLEGARMPEITEPLGQNPYLRQAREIGVATNLFSALTGNGAGQEKIDPGMAELAGNIGALSAGCPTGALGRVWLSELNKAAFILLPYLDQRRLATIWGQYIDSPCLDNIPSARSWLLLHQAVGGRDFQTAGQIARRLLPPGPLPYTQENIHLVSVAALADIREGQVGAALALLGRLEDGGHAGDNYHLRLLAAEGHGASR